MGFKNFKNYLAERTNNHGIVSDNKGFATNKDYNGDLSLKSKSGKPKEHYAPKANKNPGLMTADGSDRGQPFGNMATPGMTPKNSAPHGEKPVDKTKKTGGKKKKKAMVEGFLDKTKKMSNVQFAKHMLEDVKGIPVPKVRDLHGKEFTPEPAQTMKYVAGLMLTNENMMRRMVRELKRNNGMHILVSEILQHPETYQYLHEAAKGGFGETAQRKLGLFLEGVSPPRAGGPASANAPGSGGGVPGGAFGGGASPAQGPPGAGLTGAGNAMGNIHGGGGAPAMNGANGMPGMGEEEMLPGMDGEEGNPNGMNPDDMEDGDHEDDGLEHDDDDDLTDDDDEDNDDLDDDEDDEEEDDDDDHHDHEEESHGGGGMPGMGM